MAQDSAYTSRNIIPSVFKKFPFHGKNLDFGGGKWNTATDYLNSTFKCENWVLDPYNRSKEENELAFQNTIINGVQSITCNNVLNVIKNIHERSMVLDNLKMLSQQHYLIHRNYPIIYIQIYEGEKSANADIQTCMKTAEYIPEIQQAFTDWHLIRKGNIIILTK